MDDKIVIICATGRSGSTTMLRLINTIPNSNICGENHGAIINLLEFYKNIKYTTVKTIETYNSTSLEQIVNERKMCPAWYNSYNYNLIAGSIRNMIINLFKNKKETNVWGCKEIRFLDGKIELLKELKELFPQLKVIIHVKKNISKQCKSKWYAEDANSIIKLAKRNNEFYKFYLENKDYCYFSTFEDMFELKNLWEIFNFIGCRSEFNEKKIREVLENKLDF